MSDNMRWTFANLWNQSLEEGKGNKVLEPRDRIWASELGGSYIDRYLKMTGVQPSNPPNPRSLRKFEAGNIWEAIVGYVLSRAGILINRQKWISYQYPGLLSVTGKLDFIAGGKPDYEKSIAVISSEFNWLPEFISRATKNIVLNLKEKYPNGLEKIVLEIKSCSSFMFERYEANQTGSRQHKMQLFHYLKSDFMEEGHLVYVCKDDARLLEVGVLNPSAVETDYHADIEKISGYIQGGEQPPLEKFIIFDEEFKQFSANWKVGYSNYLIHLYKLENQKAFDDLYKPVVERWNRVLGRIAEGKEMTENNLGAIKEVEKAGFNFEEIKAQIKVAEPVGQEA